MHPTDPTDLPSLTAHVEGPVLVPGDAGYDAECTGFNRAVRHRPAAVVGATGAADVRAAVRYAADRGLAVAVQNTGHGPASAADGGLLVRTHRMTDVHVDPQARTARVAAGARFAHLVPEAAAHALAPLNGSAPHVGVAGYTLGGGISLLARSHGLAADRVRSLDVVTADGRLRHVTPERDPDLYWGLLGGRDNLGVVTALETELVPVTRLYGGGLYFDAGEVPGLLAEYRRWTATVPEAMNSSVALVPFPDDPGVPEPLRGRCAYHVRVAHTGPAAEGEQLLAPLRAAGPRLVDAVRELPYAENAAIHDEPPTPMPWYSDCLLLRDLDETAVRAVLDRAGPDARPRTIVELRHLGGAFAQRPAHPNAVGHRDARFLLGVLVPGDGDPEAVTHVRRVVEALAPWTLGRFPGFLGHGPAATPDHVRTAYAPADRARLASLKARHDPAHTFRLGHHVPPDRPAGCGAGDC